MPPAHNITSGVGKTPKPSPLAQPLDTLPTLTPYNVQAYPCSGSQGTREPVICSGSPLLHQGPQ